MNETLRNIQAELVAPKDKWNDYGKYHYRSAEGILEAIKPLLVKYHANLVLTDVIVPMEGRWYLKATAIFDSEEGTVVTEGWARESEAKKGMDESQITGTASSYARKYALNGLFLIDDNKDADTNEYHYEIQRSVPKVGSDNVEIVRKFAEEVGVTVDAICESYHIKSLEDLTMEQYVEVIKRLEKNAERRKK